MGLLSCSFGNISVFIPVPYCFYYKSSAIYLEVWNATPSTVVLSHQDCFGYLSFFCVCVASCVFYDKLLKSIYMKNDMGILIGILLTL